MLCSTTFLRYSACVALLVPTVLLGTGCSEDSANGSDAPATAGSDGSGATGGDPASGGESGASDSNTSGGDTSASGGDRSASGGDNSASAGADTSGGSGASATGVGPAPVDLGDAGNYVILAKSAIANVPTSVVTGNLGLSPAAASYITGFSLTKAGVKWTSAQVVGSVYAADNDPPTGSNLTTAVGAMQAAYTDAAGRPTPDVLNLGGGAIGGLTLAPGLYKWTSSVTVPLDVTLAGSETDTWIFQITGDLKLSTGKTTTLSGGARARNIVWQVAGTVQLGANAHIEGIVLSKTNITLGTGASINGRLLAQTAVNIAGSTVTSP